jgi:hypothetical protein
VPALTPVASYVSTAGAISIRTRTFDDWLSATGTETHQQLIAFGFTAECLESVGPLDNIAYTTRR